MTAPTLVFAGDSVTDADRRMDPAGLGQGYVRLLADDPALAGARVVNAGIAGDRVRDLRARWSEDVAVHEPAIVSVLIGVNDMWRRFDSDDPTSAADFERDYRAILDGTDGARLVLIEPFLLAVREEQAAWRADLEEKIAVVHALAAERDAVLVRADRELRMRGDNPALAADGVHPTAHGHRALADLWLEAAGELSRHMPRA
ncbi:SGNH/GDSL hydrolase family protein [Microbacterium sp. JZ31]|uniref:SGNH/GDSL hydrolase family protein n=1 Tax=Microbacterium sp. JZ31 TaxID=1906274 RepID=UPI001932B4D3|nr:SGNH/GDSL hydrolase family protein [Microbacterium sp. JZ31]